MLVVKVVVVVVLALGVLYLLAIMPHMTHRPDMTPFEGRYYAHRGLHRNKPISKKKETPGKHAPENTLAAFRKAVKAGYGIELDIQLTKDRIPVVIHDGTLKRVAKTDVRVDSLTLQELQSQYRVYGSQEYVPTLEEVLALVAGKVPLIVEFKVEAADLSLCDIAAPILDRYQGVWCMESFNPLCVRWYKKHRPAVCRGQLSTNFLKGKEAGSKVLLWILQNLLLNFLTKPDFIAFDHHYDNMLSLNLNRVLYRLPTFAWTIKSQEELEAARKHFDFMIFDNFMPGE